MKHPSLLIFFLATTVMLTACNDELGQFSGNAQDVDANNNPISTDTVTTDTDGTNIARKQICGRLVVAKQNTAGTEGCPDVPAGYSPLSNITINLLDQNNTTLNSISSNACGEFTTTTNDTLLTINALSVGNKALNVDSSIFQQDNCTTIKAIASTIPENANYKISSIQFLSDNSIAFSINDDVTNKAVIGIPTNAISIKVNNIDEPIANVDSSGGTTTTEASSTMLVLDASGSMNARVFDENNNQLLDENQNPFTRLRLAALAGHTYLDDTNDTNETGIIIFDDVVNIINDDYLANNLPLVDANNAVSNYTFSNTGFANQAADLRFIVDIYNRYSDVYANVESPIYDTRHVDSAKLTAQQRYNWGGGTALYDAISIGINQLSTRSNASKFIITMTDGSDGSSGDSSEQAVITFAKSKGIPVYTVGFGSGSDTTTLENIATKTNASFFDVKSANIGNVFQSIQTNITFQYKTTLTNTVNTGDTLNLSINYNGVTTTRDIQK